MFESSANQLVRANLWRRQRKASRTQRTKRRFQIYPDTIVFDKFRTESVFFEPDHYVPEKKRKALFVNFSPKIQGRHKSIDLLARVTYTNQVRQTLEEIKTNSILLTNLLGLSKRTVADRIGFQKKKQQIPT